MTAQASGEGVTGERRSAVAAPEWIAECKTYSTTVQEGGKIIAKFESPGLIDSTTHQRYANLFLTSRDMLAALKALRDHMSSDELNAALDQAQIVIDKAEGRRSPDTTSQSDGR